MAKALEKEKERRYSSAAELADDIRRFLRDEPIAARPPSTVYQLRKFTRRHKAIVAGVVASFLVLVIGVVATSWQAIRALRAEAVAEARARDAEVEKAKAEAVTSFLTQMLGSVDPSQARGRDVSVREALDNVERKPPVRFPWFKAEIQSTLGRVLAAERKSAEAEKLLLAGYEGLRDLPSTPLPRLRIALERLVSFHAASDRSAEAESWRNRLQAFESSRPAPKPTTTSNQD